MGVKTMKRVTRKLGLGSVAGNCWLHCLLQVITDVRLLTGTQLQVSDHEWLLFP